jgi:protein TorT
MDRSFRNGIADSAVEIVHAEAVTLTDRAIRQAIRDVIEQIDDFDALAGGSRTVQIAAEEIAGAFPSGAVELVTVTLGASTLAGIEAGRVFAGVNDKVVVQGRIGVDLAIRAVEERPHMVDLRPTLEIVDRSNVETFDRTTILPPE